MSSTAVGKVMSASGRNYYFWPWHEAWRETVERLAEQHEINVKQSFRPTERVMRELSGTQCLPVSWKNQE